RGRGALSGRGVRAATLGVRRRGGGRRSAPGHDGAGQRARNRGPKRPPVLPRGLRLGRQTARLSERRTGVRGAERTDRMSGGADLGDFSLIELFREEVRGNAQTLNDRLVAL